MGKTYISHVEGQAVYEPKYAVGYYIMAENEAGAVISHFVQVNEFFQESAARDEVNYLNGGNQEVQ